jgi:hypothetical protein
VKWILVEKVLHLKCFYVLILFWYKTIDMKADFDGFIKAAVFISLFASSFWRKKNILRSTSAFHDVGNNLKPELLEIFGGVLDLLVDWLIDHSNTGISQEFFTHTDIQKKKRGGGLQNLSMYSASMDFELWWILGSAKQGVPRA